MAGPAPLLPGTLTGGRATTVTWDIAEEVPVEPVLSFRREGKEISPTQVTNVERLASGVWVLSPLYGRSEIHELTDAQPETIRLADVSAASVISEVPTNRALSELPGLVPSPSIAATGDYFFTKRVAASGTYASSVGGGPPLLTLPTQNYAMRRIVVSNAIYPSNQCWFLSILLPGTAMSQPDWVAVFYFGGPLLGVGTAAHTGFGQYALAIAGDGRARLYEYVDAAWTLVNEWHFHPATGMPITGIGVRIFPHFPRYCEFRTTAAPFQDGLIGFLAGLDKLAIRAASHDTTGLSVFLHENTNRGKLEAGPAAGELLPFSGPGPIAVDLREELRARVQVQRLSFPESGTLTDRPWKAPPDIGASRVYKLSVLGYDFLPDDVTAATSLTGVLEQSDGSALTPGTESYTLGGTSHSIDGYIPAADGKNYCRAVITLANLESAGQRWHTPCLTGYSVTRNGVLATHAPGAFTGGTLREFSATGPGYQLETDTAGLTIEDLSNQLLTLRTRGRVAVRVETTYLADGLIPAGNSVLFEGYSGRITAKLMGKRGQVYPSPDWHTLNAELSGKWDRLADRFFSCRQYFDDDAESPSGRTGKLKRPWKVTDVIAVTLNQFGIPDSQLDVFSSDVRLFAPNAQQAEGILVIPPGTPVLDYLTRIARDYLNARLCFDPNAGAAGMWRLLQAPGALDPILWNFVTYQYYAPIGGRLPHLSASYPANTSPILDPPGELRTYVVPPEGNVLIVSGGTDGGTSRLSRTIINPASWNGPTHGSAADVSNLDYLGRRLEVAYTDVTLTTQAAVDFIARRLYDLALRGEKWAMFEAELALPNVSAVEPSIYTVRKRRPLRAGDSITINGDRWVLHDVALKFTESHAQRAEYTAQLFRPFTTYW